MNKMAFSSGILARTFTTTAQRLAIKNVTVLGGGLMGSGIAQVAAQTGHNVHIVEVSDDLLKNSQSIITKSLGRVVKKKYADNPEGGQKYLSEVMERIQLTTDSAVAVSDSDLVIEAIVENIGIKQKVFAALDAVAPEKTIFASNTSSLPIREIAEATQRKDRFGGLHFFNPVPMMKLVEVVRTPDTSDTTNEALTEFSKTMGKVSIQAKDTPGFVVNRLLVPYLMEAVKMVERGDATMEDIDMGMQLGTGVPMGPIKLNDYIGLDTMQQIMQGDASAKDVDIAMKLGSGVPMGPLELADYVGLDTCLFIINGWHEKYPDKQLFEPSDLLTQMVKDGKLGMKAGEGFYNYKKK